MRWFLLLTLIFVRFTIFAQDYYSRVLDGGMEHTQNGAKHIMSNDSCLISLSASGTNHSIITKANLKGDVIWSKLFSNGSGFSALGLAQDDDGNTYILSNIEAPTGAIRYWIQLLKIDSSGKLKWTKITSHYVNYSPTCIGFNNGKIYIAGSVNQTPDTQIFIMSLDSSGTLISYDSRQAIYNEEISCIGFFKDWIMLGGKSEISHKSNPLIIAVDPGGNIRYFYDIEWERSFKIISMDAGPDSLICATDENAFIKIGRPTARIVSGYSTINKVQLKHVSHTKEGRIILSGSYIPIEGTFVTNPFLSIENQNSQTFESTTYEHHSSSDYLGFAFPINNSSLLLGGSIQLNHYWGSTIGICNSKGDNICDAKKLNIEWSYKKLGIFTYVPESTVSKPEISESMTDIRDINIVSTINCEAKVPQADFTIIDEKICSNSCTEFLNQSTSFESYSWLFESGIPSSSTLQNPGPICYHDSGIFKVRLIGKNWSESDTIVKHIKVLGDECKKYIHIPNAFSPNGDLVNDTFFIQNNLEVDIQLNIYNSYGQLIHESKSKTPKWDGYYLEELCQQGWYFYRIQYHQNNKEVNQQGVIYLLDSVE